MYHYQKATYAVMGNPIAHSRSPQIHRLFAEQSQEQLDYLALYVPEDSFNTAVAQFRAAQGQGLNITVPFKQQAWKLADIRSQRAELAGAANTLWFNDGKIHADNTDGIGLVQDLHNHQIQLKDKHILILGAGGAVRGVLEPLLAQNPHSLTIANRSLDKAQALAAQYPQQAISACAYSDLNQKFDIIINGTSLGLQGQIPDISPTQLHGNTCLYDMFYSNTDTAFVKWGKQQSVKAYDGLGMLVEQAAASFYQWRGTKPNTAPVIAQLRSSKSD